jgi:hypothetical protein
LQVLPDKKLASSLVVLNKLACALQMIKDKDESFDVEKLSENVGGMSDLELKFHLFKNCM